MNVDGTEQTRLTENDVTDGSPAWSPDGRLLAFSSYRQDNTDIYVMFADGTGEDNRTSNPAGDTHPSWSPDGTKITFTSTRDGGNGIYIMNEDGSQQERLIPADLRGADPVWSPDGKYIAFYDYNGEFTDIYLMNADGSGRLQLTEEPQEDISPDWQTVPPAPLEAVVANGGNFRSEPRIAPETVLGQVCPGDSVKLLEQQDVAGMTWHRVQVQEATADCVASHISEGEEGWVSSVLLDNASAGERAATSGSAETADEPASTTTGTVASGGNFRNAPRVASDTLAGQVCAGDTVDILSQDGEWFEVRVQEVVEDCGPDRVEAGTEGWIHDVLLATP
jgi:TolB protein